MATSYLPQTTMPFADAATADNVLSEQAGNLSKFGRFGDTELVHMSMPEVAAIESGVGELPRNPVTGMKEAFVAPLAMLAGGAVLGSGAANSAANDEIRFANASRKDNAQQNWSNWVQSIQNMSSAMPSYMRGGDIAGPQASAMGSYFAGAVGDKARALSSQLQSNQSNANRLYNEITAWKMSEAGKEPVHTLQTKQRGGLFGLLGKKSKSYVNPDWIRWNNEKASMQDAKMAQINQLAEDNSGLAFQKADAERVELASLQTPYLPMMEGGRQALGDVFSGEHLRRQQEASRPLQDFRTRGAEASVQAIRERMSADRNRLDAERTKRRGYGGDSLSDQLMQSKLSGSIAAQEQAALLGAEGANISENKGLEMANIDRQLGMRAEPFRQLGFELEARVAPETAVMNLENQRQGILASQKLAPSNWMPNRNPPLANVPSPGTIGFKSLANAASQGATLYGASQGQLAQDAALKTAHNRNLDLINAQGMWGQRGGSAFPVAAPGGFSMPGNSQGSFYLNPGTVPSADNFYGWNR